MGCFVYPSIIPSSIRILRGGGGGRGHSTVNRTLLVRTLLIGHFLQVAKVSLIGHC